MTGARPPLQVITDRDRRGAQIFAVDLQSALDQRGRPVRTVALTEGHIPQKLPVPALGRRRFGASTLASLRREASGSHVVIAHGSSSLPAIIAATAGMRLHRVYRNIGDPLHWAGSTRKRWRVRMYLRMLDAVVALSEANAVTLTEHFGVPIQKIAVIPRGVPADRCPPISQKGRVEARRRLGLPEARIALSIGALSPEKDVGAAIRSIASIAGAYMLVVGDGPERAALERLANDAAPGRIRFTGSLADPADAFAAADLVVLPSLSEGIPGVLIEAGLYGLPAVATDVGNVREVVVDGGTGILVPSGDRSALTRALADVFEDPARLGTRARQHCLEHFELGVVAKAWDGVLTQLGAW